LTIIYNMDINDKIKKVLFKYWKENGVQTDSATLSLFGISGVGYEELQYIQSLIIEYYGGPNEVFKKMNKLKGGILYGESFGGEPIRGKVYYVVYDKGEKSFYISVLLDGDVMVESDEVVDTIWNHYVDEGLGREFTDGATEMVADMIYSEITVKTGIYTNLLDLEISLPGEF
tara:strand:+ start:8137 stop:8655 length:519 start_codon:yes stop_codon:yes gene_type:complete